MKMKIKEFAKLTNVSVRTLHYYDEIGLLSPAYIDQYTGYRFYDKNSLLRMQEILFYRELDFSLNNIKSILSSPNYNKNCALEEQKKLLLLKKERLEKLILAINDAMKGENIMEVFDNTQFENYKNEVKEKWGQTVAYQQYTKNIKNHSQNIMQNLAKGLNNIFKKFATCMKNGESSQSAETQRLVEQLQNYITENYYTCTNEILEGLGQMYSLDERFKNNIDKLGTGTAEFVSKAISFFIKNTNK